MARVSGPEASFLDQVLALCLEENCWAHHCHDSRLCSGPRGFPDLVIAGSRMVAFAELKSAVGSTSAPQTAWAWRLRAAGHESYVWRPKHLADGSIRAALQALAREPRWVL